MELKLCVGYSFFTAKALFIGEYQLAPAWDLWIVLALHACLSYWLMWRVTAVCQSSDVIPRALTCLRWICIFVSFPWQPEWWNVIYITQKQFCLLFLNTPFTSQVFRVWWQWWVVLEGLNSYQSWKTTEVEVFCFYFPCESRGLMLLPHQILKQQGADPDQLFLNVNTHITGGQNFLFRF